MAEPKVTINVSGSIAFGDGKVVSVADNAITFREPGPRGGAGTEISIPAAQWAAVVQQVDALLEAMGQARKILP